MSVYAGRYSEDLQDRYGNGFRNATVAIQTVEGDVVTLYADRDKATYAPSDGLADNEVKADGKGNLSFFADPGNYQIVVTPIGGSALPPYPVSVHGDPLEYQSRVELLEEAFVTPQSPYRGSGYGAIADGLTHPLSDYFDSLSAAQEAFPLTSSLYAEGVSLADEIDWAALQECAYLLPSRGGGIRLYPGAYRINKSWRLFTDSIKVAGMGGSMSRTPIATTQNLSPAFNRCSTIIVGMTEGMTVVDINPVAGSAEVLQHGPHWEGIALVDGIAAATTPLVTEDFQGTMTLMRIFQTNRYKLTSPYFFYGSTGLYIDKDDGISPGDGAWATIVDPHYMYCGTGMNHNGNNVDVFGGEYTLNSLGVFTGRKEGETNPSSGLTLWGGDFDIPDPDRYPTRAPGMGIRVGDARRINLINLGCESNPMTSASSETANALPGLFSTFLEVEATSNSYGDVRLRGGRFADMGYVVNAKVGRRVVVEDVTPSYRVASCPTLGGCMRFDDVVAATFSGRCETARPDEPVLVTANCTSWDALGWDGVIETGAV